MVCTNHLEALLPTEPIGSRLNFSCMERPAAIQIAVGCSYLYKFTDFKLRDHHLVLPAGAVTD